MAQRTLPVLMVCILLLAHTGDTKDLAARPPMGWNSWDAYGLTIDEPQFRANAQVLAGLKNNHGWSYGWSYAVIDEGWYLENPLAQPAQFKYSWDSYGRLIPDPKRFPSTANGVGFKPLADWVHGRDLKFGIHILRGIPRGALRDNLPVAHSNFHAADVGDIGDTCPWDAGNYGVRDTPAGQAYYDSIIGLYSRWGVDFLKVDCIADHPYKADEIRMIATAIRKSGRTMLLSLSPGPTNLSHAAEVAQYSKMWRIADDIWDGWAFPGQTFPNGLLSAFDNLAKWAKFAKPGNWPDADMLPWGSLTPHPGWGPPRQSRLTHDEQRTQFALWAMARSPLILGADLTKLDDFTRSLLTNEEVIAIDQMAAASEEVVGSPEEMARIRVWTATTAGAARRLPGAHAAWLGVFNLQDSPVRRDIPWPPTLAGKKYAIFDIWSGGLVVPSETVHVNLPPHGCALFRIEK